MRISAVALAAGQAAAPAPDVGAQKAEGAATGHHANGAGGAPPGGPQRQQAPSVGGTRPYGPLEGAPPSSGVDFVGPSRCPPPDGPEVAPTDPLPTEVLGVIAVAAEIALRGRYVRPVS